MRTTSHLALKSQCEQVAVELTSSPYLDNVVTTPSGEGIWIGEVLTSKNHILHDVLSRRKPSQTTVTRWTGHS